MIWGLGSGLLLGRVAHPLASWLGLEASEVFLSTQQGLSAAVCSVLPSKLRGVAAEHSGGRTGDIMMPIRDSSSEQRQQQSRSGC